MKRSIIIAAILAMAACVKHPAASQLPVAPSSQKPEWPPFAENAIPDRLLTEKISGILAECNEIKPGMTREQVEKVFTMDSGLQDLFDVRYVYRRCPVVKIKVTFKSANPKQGGEVSVQQTDTVTEVSKPYLEPQFVG